jgi:hypothetical protein
MQMLRQFRRQIEGVSAQPDQMRGDPLQLYQDDSNGLCPRWDIQLHQFLDRQRIQQVVADGVATREVATEALAKLEIDLSGWTR